ncbi:MAG TPA: riboflavin synthase [Candidatus Andersenbacteria bacterium]|nr:riboflavin synthase [Candidatus Andersenbacteria bacterium]
MFTGIIRNQGTVSTISAESSGAVLLEIASDLSPSLHEGDSVAVNGVCLTVLNHTDTTWTARLMQETLNKTTLKDCKENDIVNLELPVASGERMHGHIVQGHVDGVCTLSKITAIGDDRIFTLMPPQELLKHITQKGSIALDGISLTVVDVGDDFFTVSLMPYTLSHTTLGIRNIGDELNIETDKHTRSLWHSGIVHQGDQRGTSLGFPTANIKLEDSSTKLEEGVFAARATIENDPTLYAGALHVGPRPTFSGASSSIELHIINFPARNLYDEKIQFSVIEKIRDVQKFDSSEELIDAIKKDVRKATEILMRRE